MKVSYRISFLSLALLFYVSSQAQTSRKVLFLGNSYTYVNDLPLTVASVAASAGDTLVFDSNCLGGYTLQNHSTDATSLAKIQLQGWDYVVLQEQSQLPSFPISQVQADCFPYAYNLDSLIHFYNPCATTTFFMTWGRKNGDASNCASWPPVCTYQGMDSLLRLRYQMMANTCHAIVSPVGPVFHYIRDHFPTIDLYQSDESHPSAAGTYAAACSFYCSLFRKSPLNITFDGGLAPADASIIRQAVQAMVFDSLNTWNIGLFDPQASFSFQCNGYTANFTNLSTAGSTCLWSFGDGNSSSNTQPSHTYLSPGNYSVQLIAHYCNFSDTATQNLQILPQQLSLVETKVPWEITPNPATTDICIQGTDQDYRMEIYSAQGEKIKEGVGHSRTSWSIAELPAGTYTLCIRDTKICRCKTFIITRTK